MPQLSDRVQSIAPSATIAMAAKARELKSQGIDLVSLSLGEPDFDTPKHIGEAAKRAIDAGLTHYPAVDGIAEFKLAIIDKFQRDNSLQFVHNEILVSQGAKHSIYNMLQATLNPGDEVLIPAPYWVSYPDMVTLTGAKPVILETTMAENFKITPEQLDKAITPNTKLLILNSPSNPSGVAYTRSELSQLADVLLKHPDVMILSDDIYEHIYWAEEPFCNILMACSELKDRCFIINGVSKAYAMTGWRIGYMAGPSDVIAQAKKIQSQSTSGICSIAQAAATEALNASQDCVAAMAAEFKKRHDYFIPALNAINGIKARPAEGAFYSFIDISSIIEKSRLNNDDEFCETLLMQGHVATVCGKAFGLKNHIRLSYATSLDQLKEAIRRIQATVEQIC